MNAIVESEAQPEGKAAEFLTIAEVASKLRISTRTVMRLTSPEAGKDRLLAARFGNTTRIRRTALDAWLKARER
jgi:excisionase family DNA binding protein